MTKRKEYVSPTSEVVKVTAVQLLAGSPVLGEDYSGGAVLSPEIDDATLTDMILE